VSEVTARPAAEVQPEHRFAAELGFDSLTTLEFVTALTRSLPGVSPPPRTLFTTALTVAQLADHLRTAAPAPIATESGWRHQTIFDRTQQPWLTEHRPGHRPVLPLAALVVAARQALLARDDRATHSLTDFKVLVPVEVTSDRVGLEVAVADDLTFTLRESGKETPVATGAGSHAGEAAAALVAEPGAPGVLALDCFEAQFGFHGPALRALAGVPQVGAATAIGILRDDADDVVVLDGMLQVALYWLGAVRGQTAVATGFAAYRTLAARPIGEKLRCVARLANERGPEFSVDFDLYTAKGGLIAQWRGVTARVLDPAKGGAESWPEVRQLAERKAALAAAGLAMPYFQAHEGAAGATTRIAGREFLNFSSYNYLGLAGHATVNAATAAAVARYGTSASASRLASGERPLHGELERALADFLGCAAAIALVSGHATNVTLIGHLLGPEDLVLHDSLAHDCIVSGARLAGARRLVFPHNDMAALAELLARERPKARRALIAVEGVYSMDGDLAPLPAVVELKRRHDALLLVDEAHSIGVLGTTGRGVGEHFAVARGDVDFWMGTLSKALASCGGYVAGSAAVIDYLKFTLPGFVYSVGLSPANAGAALAALQELRAQPELPRRLQARSEYFRRLCRERDLDTGASAHAAVVPWMAGASARALRVAQTLAGRGINVQPIFFPAVEEGKARLRFFITAEHTEDQLRTTADALVDAAAEHEAASGVPA
jgi:8-amino-7-oxononanoate synthase